MKEEEKILIRDISLVFKENKRQILENFTKLSEENTISISNDECDIFKRGFEKVLDDFIKYLSEGDFEGYYSANALIAEEIAYNDISYKKFINTFHLFEDSYGSVLADKFGEKQILKYLTAIDQLHHNTIAIISEKYFEVKDTTVIALVRLAELRDFTTGNHLERTREYLVVLAKEMGFDSDYISNLYKAGPLHDIGKVGIRDSILLKPSKLTEEELGEMKQHAVIGAQTISKIIGNKKASIGYLPMAKNIAMYHHERYDGNGYPKGLAGEEIPLEARIFALVDAYDAIKSKRPYKEDLPHEEAVRRIMADSGKHFDPDIVKAFLKVHKEFEEIFEAYKQSV